MTQTVAKGNLAPVNYKRPNKNQEQDERTKGERKMTRFTDGYKTVGIHMAHRYGSGYDSDYSADFFEVGGLRFDEGRDAYEVFSVEYLIGMLVDYLDGVGDFIGTKANDNEYVWVFCLDGEVSDTAKMVIEEAENSNRIVLA